MFEGDNLAAKITLYLDTYNDLVIQVCKGSTDYLGIHYHCIYISFATKFSAI